MVKTQTAHTCIYVHVPQWYMHMQTLSICVWRNASSSDERKNQETKQFTFHPASCLPSFYCLSIQAFPFKPQATYLLYVLSLQNVKSETALL